MNCRNILLIIGGGIAAYKSLELIRRFKTNGFTVRVVLTEAGSQFVTPVTAAALSGQRVLQDMFEADEQGQFDHIRLSREADLVVVAPATADLMAQMAAGLAGNLAGALLLASNKPILIAPAMNSVMWAHPATQRNLARLKADGIHVVGPNSGELACGEEGAGRMSEPAEIFAAAETLLGDKPLAGKKALVTAGPTYEPIDPVRFLGNRSSGKQGYAIAAALTAAGAETVLISGPTALTAPAGVKRVQVETADEMLAACRTALPADIAVFAAAVADWRPTNVAAHKLKKDSSVAPTYSLTENPDILRSIATGTPRPTLVVGFAAETEALAENARKKRATKGCDWILANDVSQDVFGADKNRVLFCNGEIEDFWPESDKSTVGTRLAEQIAAYFQEKHS